MNDRLTKQPGPGINILRQLLGIKQKTMTREEWRQWYSQYLQSPEWRHKARKCLILAEYQCKGCGSVQGPLQAHHKTYKRAGAELQKDLVCLCDDCHKKEHGIRMTGDNRPFAGDLE